MSLKLRLCLALVSMTALLLAGCSSLSPDPTSDTGRGVSPTPEALSAPAACEKYASSPAPAVAGGDPIVQAASRADLPAGAVLSPGVQVLFSAGTPGMYDAIVHVCSLPLTRAKLIAIGDSVAAAVNADPSRNKLSTLTMQSWVQIGTDAAGEDPNTPSISLDFQTYAGSSPAPIPGSAWQ